jgi:uncharacterized protein
MAFAMGWEILWPLILGFTLSAVVQAVVSHREMARLLPDDRPATIAKALALGAASSSCSYAAVAIARSLFRKGADFTAAMAFEMASTNLVVELAIIMLVFLGWQFTLAEFVGAPIMVALLVVLFRQFLNRNLLDRAKEQADKGLIGRMEGHAEMDMSVGGGGTLWRRITSERGFTAISHYFVMDWASVWLDIAGGLLIAGALAAWVPAELWQSFFVVDHAESHARRMLHNLRTMPLRGTGERDRPDSGSPTSQELLNAGSTKSLPRLRETNQGRSRPSRSLPMQKHLQGES